MNVLEGTIPIIAYGFLLASSVSFVVFLMSMHTYRERGDGRYRHFALLFFWLGAYFAIWHAPAIIGLSSGALSFFYSISYGAIFLVFIHATFFTARITGAGTFWSRVVPSAIAVIGFAVVVTNLIFVGPILTSRIGVFVYSEPEIPAWVKFVTAFFCMTVSNSLAQIFFPFFRSPNPILRVRALFGALGFFIMPIAGVIYFVGSVFVSGTAMFTVLFSSVATIVLGTGLVAFGLHYRRRELRDEERKIFHPSVFHTTTRIANTNGAK